MNRVIKFKTKNGKNITIRRLRDTDYVAVTKYFKEFQKGPGAKWTWWYPTRPLKTQEQMTRAWADENQFFVAAFDGDKVVGVASAHKKQVDNPWAGRMATTGTTLLEKYTSNGIGTKFKQIVEKWARDNNVHKLQAEVRHKNVRSLGNLMKQGYEIVGIMRDTAFIDGEWQHEYILEKILEE
ncbi:MAG: GNAT family N-acetyltransferase [Alphaproteobacteria bacterium]|nr:GNAT family N-acetyltransferase [Alphaproteobacteria bacterium]